jgi:response regulator RpfG family c-di-GMP phosphodiesterase
LFFWRFGNSIIKREASPGIKIKGQQMSQLPGAKDNEVYSGPPVNLLYLEDTPTDRDLFLEKLRRYDPEGRINVIHFSDGLEAAEYVVSNPIDAAILDIEVPGLSGDRLNSVIRTFPHGRDIPVLWATYVDDPGKLHHDRRSQSMTRFYSKSDLRRNLGTILHETLTNKAA